MGKKWKETQEFVQEADQLTKQAREAVNRIASIHNQHDKSLPLSRLKKNRRPGNSWPPSLFTW
ncbi:MAG: hypothetical protein KC592_11100 [Nitrospira sp.]|nr:hypothetical protein [Nitrospira sp.]MCW5784614.1 hypothetical protein [Nitrospirales bacterium]